MPVKATSRKSAVDKQHVQFEHDTANDSNNDSNNDDGVKDDDVHSDSTNHNHTINNTDGGKLVCRK